MIILFVTMTCTLCHTKLQSLADEFYFICDTCGAYVKNSQHYLSREEEKERYLNHENDVNDVHYQKFTSPITDAIFENQQKSHLGLDFGCGTGPIISKQLTDSDFQVILYDPFFAPNEIYKDHRYDYIFSCEVFEHFHHPKQEIESLLSLLKPNGRLYVMTHIFDHQEDFETWYYRNDPTHVFIYTKKTMRYIASTYQLELEVLSERLVILKKS